jgi:hypothetical protein
MKALRPLFVLALLLFFGNGSARAAVADGDSPSGGLDLRGESKVTFSQRTDGSKLVDIRYTAV